MVILDTGGVILLILAIVGIAFAFFLLGMLAAEARKQRWWR